MSTVGNEFLARWRQEAAVYSGRSQTRMQKPVTRVYIREGYLQRANAIWDGPEVDAFVVGGDNDLPWQATYVPTSDWVELPNITSCDLSIQFDTFRGIGLGTATVVVDNTVLAEQTGLSDLYHAIERGWLSPYRGAESDFTPPAEVDQNDWYRMLDQKVQIKIWQGYGVDTIVPTFMGFIDDLAPAARPDKITIQARDASQIMADQRFFGWSKEPTHPDPVTFADRLDADDTEPTALTADASSDNGPSYTAANVLDYDTTTAWVSQSHSSDSVTEWVEITIPEGRYESFKMDTRNYGGMTAYVAVYSVDGEVDGVPVADGWIDGGLGDVPGANGGYPYVKTKLTNNGLDTIRLPFEFVTTSDSSRIRIALRFLRQKDDDNYYGSVTNLTAIKRTLSSVAASDGWILVDDVSDIVKLILRWCGFKEWYAESANMRLKKPWTVNRETFLMDMIDRVVEQTGYTFFMADPGTEDESMGVPVFRMNRSLYELDDVPSITEDNLLRAAQATFTTEPLVHIIRVRGRTATKNEGGEVMSRDERRLMAVWRPPWVTETSPIGIRTARIYKRTILDRWYLRTQTAVDYAARLAALYMALASAQALVEIPANPGLGLDEHVLLKEIGTGLNTRMWINGRTSRFTGGAEPTWVMSLSGALLDTPNMEMMRDEIASFTEGLD